jgi:hypothetical protein
MSLTRLRILPFQLNGHLPLAFYYYTVDIRVAAVAFYRLREKC